MASNKSTTCSSEVNNVEHVETDRWIIDAAVEIEMLRAENRTLRAALRGLHDDIADYIRLNNLGGYDNHWMKEARAALAMPAPQPSPGSAVPSPDR